MYAVLALVALIVLFLLLLTMQALMFKPRKQPVAGKWQGDVDGDRAVANLQKMVQCRTVSHDDTDLEDNNEFAGFQKLLAQEYPLVHRHCRLEKLGRRGLLYHWPGRSPDKPTVYMSHYDVVPADASVWQHPPFDGVIQDGFLWGRGTLDTKVTLCGILEAAEQLIDRGFVPANDIYLSFAGDEETSGDSASAIVDHLEGQGVRPHMVLDEGGAVVEGVLPGVKGKCALVGTGEKGKMHLRLSVTGKGGHASSPPRHTPVGRLARAICRVEDKPLPYRLATPAREMLETLGRHAGFAPRLLYANLGLLGPLLDFFTRKTGGEINALVRTTVAFTKMQASDAVNVFPPAAHVDADVRINQGSTGESVITEIEQRINDPEVKVHSINTIEVRPFSATGTEPWQRISTAIGQLWPGSLVSPYLMIAATDSRHFTRISDNVLRFSAMELSAEERKTIHGNDERIPLEKIEDCVKFFLCLMEAS